MITSEEIKKLADREWKAFPGATGVDEMVWKNGFMNGYISCQIDQANKKLDAVETKLTEVLEKKIHRQSPPPPPADRVIKTW